MPTFDLSRGAAVAGSLLFAMPVLDVVLGGAFVGAVHAVVGSFGLALLAVSAAAGAGRR